MPEETSFTELYRKLLDLNFVPAPERAEAALQAVLRQLWAGDPKKPEDPCGSSAETVII